MKRRQRSWNDVRGFGFLIAVAIAMAASLGAWALHTALTAKAPGETNCYKDVCHRVYTLDETRRMIGQSVELHATHYDDPSIDKMNTGELTSSGEAFDASNPARTSASNYPDGTELLLWSPTTRRASHVRVNDFGPFWGKRTIDVTRRVADDLGFAKAGVAQLRVFVIWVPPPQAARYKKYRTYPMSFGLLGVVEADQLDTLARRLIATADQRNRELMPRPIEPPNFAAEAAAMAAAEAAMMPRRVADLMANVPKVDLGAQPVDLHRRVYAGPPGLRVEAVKDVPIATAEAKAKLAAALAANRPPMPSDLPAELQPPVAVAVAQVQAPPVPASAVLAPVSEPVPAPVVIASAPPVAQPDEVRVAPAGPTLANRSRVDQQVVPAEKARPKIAVAPEATVPGPAASVRSADPPVRVTVALAQRQFEFGHSGLPLWIGIAVMLTTFLSVAGLARRRKGAAVPAPTSDIAPVHAPATTSSGQDPLAVARHAAARAEADARELLARETADRGVASLAEAQAREDLAREIARRETEREAHMRLRLEVAAEAQAEAMRELEAIDAARRARHVTASIVPPVLVVPIAPVAVAAPVAIAAPAPTTPPPGVTTVAPSHAEANVKPVLAHAAPAPAPAPKPIVVEPPPAVFPGVSDPKLAAAILGRAGASAYWGNTIIAQARLDGTARSGSPLRIDGVVDGACYAPVVLVAEGATVTGVLAADTIIVLGTVSGILSGRKITVAKTAQVEGEIYYQSMSIDPQAQCDVRFRRLAGDADPVAVGTAAFDAHMNRQTRAA